MAMNRYFSNGMARGAGLGALLVALVAGCGEVVPSGEDPCETLACECEVAADCGAHAYCDDSEELRVCVCVDGYVKAGDGACVWGEVPLDPGFEDGAAWMTSGGAVVDKAAEGDVDPGQAQLDVEALCAMGRVSQEVMMPAYEDAEPLVAVVNHRSVDGSGLGDEIVGPGIGIGGSWKTFGPTFGMEWKTERFCLGESAYGGPITVAAAPQTLPYFCGNQAESSLAIDRFEIVPADAGECPMPGQIPNADFEGADGWTGSPSGTGAAADYAAGAGDSGSGAYHLSTATLCSGARVTGKASLPAASTMPSLALEVWWHATEGEELAVVMDNATIAQLPGRGPLPQTTRVCIPPALHGSVVDLSFALPYTSGACMAENVRDAYVDDVRFVSEPGCAGDAYIADGGLESGIDAGVVSAWTMSAAEGRSTAAIVTTPGVARTGNGAIELSVQQECSAASARATVVVPEPAGDAGPALVFWYKAGNNPETTFSSAPGIGALQEPGQWRREVVCLDARMAGRPQQVSFTLSPGGGVCADIFATEYAYVDDVSVTTDLGCPAP